MCKISILVNTIGTRFVDPPPPPPPPPSNRVDRGSRVFVFLEMGLYRSRIEFLVMFEVVQHCIMKTSHKSDELNKFKKRGGSTNRVPMVNT